MKIARFVPAPLTIAEAVAKKNGFKSGLVGAYAFAPVVVEGDPAISARPAFRMIVACKCGATWAGTVRAATTRPAAGGPSVGGWIREDGGFLPAGPWRCDCGRVAQSTTVKGVRSAHVCDARCMSSTSGKCECSCGGKNHGAAWG